MGMNTGGKMRKRCRQQGIPFLEAEVADLRFVRAVDDGRERHAVCDHVSGRDLTMAGDWL